MTVPSTAASDPNRAADRYWDCGDLDGLFGDHAQVIAPWPRAPRQKAQPAFDRNEIGALLRSAVDLVEIDPRDLWASQPWILRRHADHYLTGRWERTGETSADRHTELNQFPVMVCDHRQRRVIVSGHHRATAALVQGRPLLVRIARTGTAQAITPLLWYDPTAADADADAAASQVSAGDRATVPTLDVAELTLQRLGVEPEVHRATIERVRTRC